jgi:hypothetical protein
VSLIYGERSENQGGYARLATSVMIRAVKDVHGMGGVSAMERDRLKKTARAFLSNPSNESLKLWCAWVKMDPIRVKTSYASILDRNREKTTTTV